MRRSITLEKRPCNMKRIAIPELIEYTTIFFKLFKRKETFFSWNEKSNKIVKEILSLTSWWNVSFCQVDKERSFLVDLRLNSTRKELSSSTWGSTRQGKIFPCRVELQVDRERSFLLDLRQFLQKAWIFLSPHDKLIFRSL